MTYDIAHYWSLLLIALVIGGFVGGATWAESSREGPLSRWMTGWMPAAALCFIVGLLLAVSHILRGRAGLWLETALLAFIAYIAGCFLGGWLRAVSHASLAVSSGAAAKSTLFFRRGPGWIDREGRVAGRERAALDAHGRAIAAAENKAAGLDAVSSASAVPPAAEPGGGTFFRPAPGWVDREGRRDGRERAALDDRERSLAVAEGAQPGGPGGDAAASDRVTPVPSVAPAAALAATSGVRASDVRPADLSSGTTSTAAVADPTGREAVALGAASSMSPATPSAGGPGSPVAPRPAGKPAATPTSPAAEPPPAPTPTTVSGTPVADPASGAALAAAAPAGKAPEGGAATPSAKPRGEGASPTTGAPPKATPDDLPASTTKDRADLPSSGMVDAAAPTGQAASASRPAATSPTSASSTAAPPPVATTDAAKSGSAISGSGTSGPAATGPQSPAPASSAKPKAVDAAASEGKAGVPPKAAARSGRSAADQASLFGDEAAPAAGAKPTGPSVAAPASPSAAPVSPAAVPTTGAPAAAGASHPGDRPAALDTARDGTPDDLKLIKGIGPKNEAACHALGVYHFSQIADWSPQNAVWVGHHIAFPGRIEREHWIPQAKLLALGIDTAHSAGVRSGAIKVDEGADAPLSEADAAAVHADMPALSAPVADEGKHAGARPLGFAAPQGGTADDLKRIKGIGKQNEARLHGLGVWHFDQIAGWSAENVKWVGSYLAFPGRITREQWIVQAADLAAGRETPFSRRVAAGLVKTSVDDGSKGQGNVAKGPPRST